MVSSAVTAAPYAERRGRTKELLARYPFARELLDFYGAVVGIQEQAFVDARSASFMIFQSSRCAR